MSIEAPSFEIAIPEPKVEVIAETRKNTRRERFIPVESSIEGVLYIAEPGSRPTFNKRKTRRLQADSDRIARWRKYERLAQPARQRLIGATKEQEGFRGIASSRGNYEAPLVPTTKVIYDPDLLAESTGPYHTVLVRESGRLTIDLPFGSGENARERLAELAHAIAQLMVDEGRDPQEVGSMITPTIIQRLDEEELNRKISDGSIELLPGTKTEEISWATPINPIDKKTSPRRQKPLELITIKEALERQTSL